MVLLVPRVNMRPTLPSSRRPRPFLSQTRHQNLLRLEPAKQGCFCLTPRLEIVWLSMFHLSGALLLKEKKNAAIKRAPVSDRQSLS